MDEVMIVSELALLVFGVLLIIGAIQCDATPIIGLGIVFVCASLMLMENGRQQDFEASKVRTITVYNEAGDIVKTYSGRYMNIENTNNIIYFTCNHTNMSFAVDSSSNKDGENYTVVVDDNTAKSLGLEQNDTGNADNSDVSNQSPYNSKDLYEKYTVTQAPAMNYSGSAIDLQ